MSRKTHQAFLQQSHLPERFSTLGSGDTFTIGETGFGAGLNFLATWELWRQAAPADTKLHFISVEKSPLHPADLKCALAQWSQLESLSTPLIDAYPPLLANGVHRLHFGNVTLTLVIGEASAAFRSLRQEDEARDRVVDAWFLDGFAPPKNPDMWTEELFTNIAALSRPGATFATFSSAGLVQGGPQEAGFSSTPWHLPGDPPQQKTTIAVIGAGISGATTARALAERGLRVQVFERGPHPGAGASGNNQGILYAKLSPKPGPNGDYNLHALMYAQRYYREHCAESVHFGGLLQLAQSEKEIGLQGQIAELLQEQRAEALVRDVDAAEASEIAGLPLDFGGLYFPQAGWLEPQRVCATLLEHENIEVHCNTSIEKLEAQEGGWFLHCAPSQVFFADTVVICTANAIRQFPQTAPLPLRPIRGQVSGVSAVGQSQQLKTALCGEGYITPPHNNRHSFGATFKLKDSSTELREEEQGENLQTLARLLPQVAEEFSSQTLTARAALRAASPDYLPMVGPVPDWDSLENTYAGLRKNRKSLIPEQAAYQRNLYVLGGLGSRGFTYAPLAAEVLTAWVCGGVMPVSNELVRALHPARFAIRDLGRNR